MILEYNTDSVFVFDLDDTLYQEKDYLISAFNEIAEHYRIYDDAINQKMIDLFYNGENVFSYLIHNYPSVTSDKNFLLKLYREHKPSISLSSDTIRFLSEVKKSGIKTGLLSDGRTFTQRNKLEALGLSDYFDKVVVSEEFGSEKPDIRNYKAFYELNYKGNFFYFGDNLLKDFITPNKLGWETICILDNGRNIHKQDHPSDLEYNAKNSIKSFSDIELVKKY